MKTGFKNPFATKEGKKMKSAWDFTCPNYDQRSSCYVNAGSHYGIGHRQPVGHKGHPKSTSPVLPKGRINTMEVDGTEIKDLSFEAKQ